MYYVRYRRRHAAKWSQTDGMSWTAARQVADALAKLGLHAEVATVTLPMMLAPRRAS